MLQTTWLAQPIGWAGGARIDLPLLLVISTGLLYGARAGLVCGLAAGLLCGITSSYNLGSFAISRMVVGGLGGTFDQRFSRDNPLAAPLCMAGGTVLAHMVFGLMSPADFAQPLGRFLCGVLLNTVVGTILHLGLSRFAQTRRDMEDDYLSQHPVPRI